MYKIVTNTGETHLTERPNFIRKHENGCFVLTDEATAEGVAYKGTPYLFADGTIYSPFDSGILLSTGTDATVIDVIESQVTYTAMMTDTLLEG